MNELPPCACNVHLGYMRGGPAMGVRYGVAVSALKQTNPGDLCWATADEVERLLKGGNLRIVR